MIGGAHDAGVERIVYVSSASVFGVGHDMVSVETPVARAAGAYAESKAAAEHYVRARQDQGAPVAITYPSGVLGPDSPQYTVTHQGVGLWLKVALLTPTGIAIVDVRDLARAHVRALERGGAGRYMIGGHFSTWTDWATVLRGLTGRRVLRLHVPGAVLRGFGRVVDRVERLRQGDLPLTLEAMEIATQNQPADSRAAVDALEITFRPLEETLADTIAWMVAAGHVTAKQAGALAP